MSSKYRFRLPHDDIAHGFLKFLNNVLAKAKFEKNFERLDPGSLDMYRYENKKGDMVVITRSPVDEDMEELKITSEKVDISKIIDRAAVSYGKYIAEMIKAGRGKG